MSTSTSAKAEPRGATEFDRRLGEFVRTSRLRARMGQVKLAEILGVTFQQVQKYEKGVNRLSAKRLFDISLAFDIPVQDFYASTQVPAGSDAKRVRAKKVEKTKRPRKRT